MSSARWRNWAERPPSVTEDAGMRPLTEAEIRRSFVNCSRGEAKALTLPRGFDEIAMLGWRDPKAPLRGYVVLEGDAEPVGIAVRAAESRMSSRTAAMCLLCQ